MTCEWVLSCPISESQRLLDRAVEGGREGTNNSSTSSARHFRGLSLPSQNHLQAHEQPGQSGFGETLSESEKIGQTETRRVMRAVATPHNRHACSDRPSVSFNPCAATVVGFCFKNTRAYGLELTHGCTKPTRKENCTGERGGILFNAERLSHNR